MSITQTEKNFLFILLIIVSIVAILILYPFLTVFILSAAFSVILYPVYLWIKKHTYKQIPWIASILTIITFLIVLCIPLFLVGTAVFEQTQDAYYSIVANGGADNFINKVDNSINRILPEGFSFDTKTKIENLMESFASNIASIFTSTFQTVLMFTIMILTMYYMLKDGEKWERGLIKILPLSDQNASDILSNLTKSINRVLKGSFIIAIAQGILAFIGFTIFGIPHAAIWAVVASIASFIPTLGTSIVSVPAIVYLFLSGMQLQAIGLLLWSVLLISTIDNLLNPYIISKDSEIPPIFILFSILGGISLIGPIGILIGPLVLSLLYTLICIYKKELKNRIAAEKTS